VLGEDENRLRKAGPMQYRAAGLDGQVGEPPPAGESLARAGDADVWINRLDGLDDRARRSRDAGQDLEQGLRRLPREMQPGGAALAREKFRACRDPLAGAADERDRCAAPAQHRRRDLDAGDRHGATRRKDDTSASAFEPERLGGQVAAGRVLRQKRVDQGLGSGSVSIDPLAGAGASMRVNRPRPSRWTP
jgi:hypothetical protein